MIHNDAFWFYSRNSISGSAEHSNLVHCSGKVMANSAADKLPKIILNRNFSVCWSLSFTQKFKMHCRHCAKTLLHWHWQYHLACGNENGSLTTFPWTNYVVQNPLWHRYRFLTSLSGLYYYLWVVVLLTHPACATCNSSSLFPAKELSDVMLILIQYHRIIWIILIALLQLLLLYLHCHQKSRAKNS